MAGWAWALGVAARGSARHWAWLQLADLAAEQGLEKASGRAARLDASIRGDAPDMEIEAGASVGAGVG